MTEPNGQEATEQLISRLQELVADLQTAQSVALPAEEPYLASGSAIKGSVKRGVFRATRPATRRYDRLATAQASVALELAEQLLAANAHIDRLRGDIDRLDHAIGSLRSSAADPAGRSGPADAEGAGAIPDAFYWAFEARMRGSSGSVLDRLRGYEHLAVSLREELRAIANGHDASPPLWIDLGCGLGEFGALVREWGWGVEGVDSSPAGVEACRAQGIDATLADVFGFLASRRGEAPGAISAIQLIEHLPRSRWIDLFDGAHKLLAPGGALLVETINALNPEALTAYFLADVTHTWPGHPDTLSLMAEHVGFDEVEVVFMNPDERGNAQDFAIWARKAGSDRDRERPAPTASARANTTEP
ncbi:MAG TPA: methyltransferase domain-containing protein [Actinomycetota bacterium]